MRDQDTTETELIADGAGPRALAPPVPARGATGAAAVREADFPIVLRGYDRGAVDAFLDELADLIDVLEARQTRDSVVQRALEEVGQETSAILKQAHETADEVAARSRAQAEDRVERARVEAGAITAEGHERVGSLRGEIEELEQSRDALIADLRALGGEAAEIADRAEARLAPAPPDESDPPETEEQDPAG